MEWWRTRREEAAEVRELPRRSGSVHFMSRQTAAVRHAFRAAHSGAFGFKQTFGRVPVYPPSQNGTLFHVTPLTRSVRDAALLLDVIARPDTRDWNALPPADIAWGRGIDEGIKGLRIAFSPALGYAQVDPEVEKIVADAVKVFADHGAIVELVDPGIEDPLPIFLTFWQGRSRKASREFCA